MRRLLVPFLLLLLAPATASARPGPPPPPQQDGTLSVREGRGILILNSRGSITGRLERGKLTITDPTPYDSKRPVVYGASKVVYRNVRTTVYQGRNLRYRLIGALYKLRVEGRGIFLSAVGRGVGSIDGTGDPAAGIFFDGTWSLNDEEYHSLPDEPTGFQLAAPPSR